MVVVDGNRERRNLLQILIGDKLLGPICGRPSTHDLRVPHEPCKDLVAVALGAWLGLAEHLVGVEQDPRLEYHFEEIGSQTKGSSLGAIVRAKSEFSMGGLLALVRSDTLVLERGDLCAGNRDIQEKRTISNHVSSVYL